MGYPHTADLTQKLKDAEERIAELEELLTAKIEPLSPIVTSPAEIDRQVQDLIQSRNKYRKLFNYANDAMFVISMDKNSTKLGYFSDVNNVACKRLGYSRGEMLQMTHEDISIEQNEKQDRLANLLRRDGNATFETTYVKKDGSLLPMEVSAMRLSIDGKDLYMAIARDITERKQAEKALTQSEHLYKLLADNVHDIIWTTDSNYTPQYISPSFAKFTGLSVDLASETLSKHIVEKAPFIQITLGIFTDNEPKPFYWESELEIAGGRTIWVESLASPLPFETGKFTGLIGVTRNITKRKQMIFELEKAKEFSFKANRSKSEFLANMSHEVRTPMNGVIGMLQLLKMTQLDEEQLEFVDTAMASGESLLTIINDILDYSKIEAGKLQITPTDFLLREMVRTLLTSFSSSVNPTKVTLQDSVADDVPDLLIADPIRFRQILYNLVGNAVKFTDEGKIRVAIEIAEHIDKKRLKLFCTVSDTGIGIPEDASNKIFDPFTQIDSEKQRKIRGTGLGLSIVKKLVEQMGGEVYLACNDHGGTTATFTLLVEIGTQTQSLQPTQPTSILTSPIHRLSVLIVEDEIINQQILQAILHKLGHISTVAENGKKALQILKEKSFDIVLMDVQMPELDGIQTTQIIRNRREYEEIKDIPIIALTAYAMAGDKDKCLACGMNSYLPKPVDVKTLEVSLKNLTTNK